MKTTMEGRRFVIATLLILLAALNTGNNLIYLILGLMCSLLFLSVMILRINLKGLTVKISYPEHIYAGEKTYITASVANGRKHIPAFSLSVQSPEHSIRVYLPKVPPGGSVQAGSPIVFRKRGLHRSGEFSIRSSFPLIFFDKTGAPCIPGEILVYPSLIDVGTLDAAAEAEEGPESLFVQNAGEELYSMRKFRHGDDWRRIHWKASAKADELLFMEYAGTEAEKVTIVLENVVCEKGADSDALFEKAVSVAASITGDYIHRSYLVRLVTAKKVIPFGRGDEHFLEMLDLLAVIHEEEEWDSVAATQADGRIVAVAKSRDARCPEATEYGHVIYADSL